MTDNQLSQATRRARRGAAVATAVAICATGVVVIVTTSTTTEHADQDVVALAAHEVATSAVVPDQATAATPASTATAAATTTTSPPVASPTTTITVTTSTSTTTTSVTPSTTSTTVTPSTTTEAAPIPSPVDVCTAVADAIDSVHGAFPGDDAAFAASLRTAADALWEASRAAGEDLRDEISLTAVTIDDYADLAGALGELQVETERGHLEVGRVRRTLPGAVLFLLQDEVLEESAPELVSTCGLSQPGEPSGVEWLWFGRSVQALVRGDASNALDASQFWPVTLISSDVDDVFGDLLLVGVTIDHFEECLGDPTARVLGDNAGCDAYMGACAGGNGHACNDLYWISPLSSSYEQFGATCGLRVERGDPRFAGGCDAAS